MMGTIGISVANFCLASVPFNCTWEDGGKVPDPYPLPYPCP